MDSSTYNSLSSRLTKLELQAGEKDNSGVSLVSQVQDLQAKVDALYRSNAELQTLDRIIETIRDPKKHIAEVRQRNNASEAEKQERLLSHFPVIREAYANLAELSTLDIPALSAETVDNIDLTLVQERKEAIQGIMKAYHLLVVKNTLVFEKYMALMERENGFWIDVERKLSSMKIRLDELEDKKYEV